MTPPTTAALTARHGTGAADAGWLVSGSPDVVYRKVPYRISEPLRENGASVRPAVALNLRCLGCPRILKAPTLAFRYPDRSAWACLRCAVQLRALVPFAWACTLAPATLVDAERARAGRQI